MVNLLLGKPGDEEQDLYVIPITVLMNRTLEYVYAHKD